MKALSLLQPWASLIVIGAKQYETRSWSTNYRGQIAIHASKRYDQELKDITYDGPFYHALAEAGLLGITLPTAAVIGTVEIVDCIQISRHNLPGGSTSWEAYFGDYTPGRYMWKLANPVRFDKPIPARGALNLWEWKEVPA